MSVKSYVSSAPVVLGKQRMGIIIKTKAHATVPMAPEYFPRFQGPGLKRLPTRKTRIKIGMVNALSDVSGAIHHTHRYSHKSRNSTNRKQGPDRQLSTKYQQQAQYADCAVEPHSICRRLRMSIDPLPVS